jgi:hypothetical protein
MAAGFGLTIGVGGTLALLSPHAEKSIIDKNEPASNLTMVEKAPRMKGKPSPLAQRLPMWILQTLQAPSGGFH